MYKSANMRNTADRKQVRITFDWNENHSESKGFPQIVRHLF